MNHFNAEWVGDIQADPSTNFPMAGEVAAVPLGDVGLGGDVELGGDVPGYSLTEDGYYAPNEGDVGEDLADLAAALSDEEIDEYLGDVALEDVTWDGESLNSVGDMPFNGLLVGAPLRRRRRSIYSSRRGGRPVPSRWQRYMRKPKLSPTEAKAKMERKKTAAVIASIPGAALSRKAIASYIVNGGAVTNKPTRALVSGSALEALLRRAENQYPSTTRYQTNAAAAGTVAFTFAAPAVNEGGNVQFVPAIIVQISMQRQLSVSQPEIGLSITGIAESGNAVDARQWRFQFTQSLDSLFLVAFPFTEVSSTLLPQIVQANANNNLTVTLTGVPSTSNVKVALPGLDNAQFVAIKKGLGLTVTSNGLMSN